VDSASDFNVALSKRASTTSAIKFTLSDPSVTTNTWKIEHDSSENLQIFGYSADSLLISTNSIERMRVASNGNVGIGTTSPSAKLEVQADVTTNVDVVHFSNSNSVAKAKISLSANSSGELSLIDGNNNTDVFISSNGNSYFNGGNVGIGTTSPDRRLHVRDTAIVTTKLEGTSQGSLLDLVNSNVSQTYNGLRFTQGTTSKMAITHIADGTTKGYVQIGNGYATGSEILVVDGRTSNVGIGTTSPNQSNLVVSPSAQSADVDGITVVYNPDGATNRVRSQLKIDDFSGVLELTNSADTIATYITAGGDSYFTAGNVGIGTTSPNNLLEISGIRENQIRLTSYDTTAYADEIIGGIEFYSSDAGNEGVKAKISAISTDATGSAYLSFFTGTGQEQMRITNTGNVGIGTTDPQSKLQVDGGVQMADDTDAASADKVGTLRYRTSGNNSYVDMCMQTGATTYEWVNIVQNNW
jgi:hypothetical protein